QMKLRRLLELAGLSSAALAAFGIGRVGRSLFDRSERLRFRATLGLPEPPLPSYATYVVDGALDLVRQTGVVTGRVMAGHPGARSEIGLPGLARIVTVTGVDDRDTQLTIRGLIEDTSQLQPGEDAQVEFVIHRARGVVHAPFGK